MNDPDSALQRPTGWPCRGLYAITPECADDARLLRLVAAVLAGGAALLQYRAKLDAPRQRTARAHALCALCHDHGVPFIVNDDIETALAVGAAGVHLGEGDAGIGEARARMGEAAIIGASCYDDLARAKRARRAGASYVAFGAFFPSPTKPRARRAAPALLRQAAELQLPRVAIGGIRLDNVRPLLDAGAELVAVISDLFDHPDPRRRSAEYAALIAAHAPDPDTP